MSLYGLLAASNPIYQSCKAWVLAVKRFIHFQFGDYPNGPFSASAAVEEVDIQGKSITEQARSDEITDMAFFAAKGVLYGWSAYNIVSNNPNPIDVIVACAAIVETCGYQVKPQRRAI